MTQGRNNPPDGSITDYRYPDKRKNNPPAGLAAQGQPPRLAETRYAYDPHLPPVLRFDPAGGPDHLQALLEKARTQALSADEVKQLSDALQNQQPWLEWAGKREKRAFAVDPVALHIHERISAQAMLKLAQREPVQRSLFADPELDYRQAVQFYHHDMAWANRLILGDSLVVMNSLAKREDLAGKVQMIYLDPPYGIKFASNFQPTVGKRDVKDKDEDLTREPEQIKAYRDTWTLGVHSYLAYLRDRLIVARELLTDSGSIFVQISEENVHRIRALMDEVFGSENFVGQITFNKTTGAGSPAIGTLVLASVCDYIVWYAKDKKQAKYHQIYQEKDLSSDPGGKYAYIETEEGIRRRLTSEEADNPTVIHSKSKIYRLDNLTSQASPIVPYAFQEKTFYGGWKTNQLGLDRLLKSGRIVASTNILNYVRFMDDFPAFPLNNAWMDVGGIQSRADPKIYVVQTNSKAIQRCMLMTTDPGDLVVDPTCGSGTTAYVAEQWGRRWITMDTSRVAVALARQRLLTARFDYYELADENKGVASGFKYKTVPHITLASIARNQTIDQIFARWEPRLVEKLAALNSALAQVSPETRTRLQTKLAHKERTEGKSSLSEADRRRWLLPKTAWQAWEVPFDSDPDWPADLQQALQAYRTTWRQKMDEVNAAIAASAPQETLVDQPRHKPNVLRVSGPFTVEGVEPGEASLDLSDPLDHSHETDLPTFPDPTDSLNAGAYLEKMVRLLRQDGVRFPDNKTQTFERLEPLNHPVLHAEGEWLSAGQSRRVAVSFGPQYGPVTVRQVEDGLRSANRGGYDELIFAGFSFDATAQAIIQEDPNPRVRAHLTHIRPDVNMDGLLKDTSNRNLELFTVFGLPRAGVQRDQAGEYVVKMEGVDIYDPVNNTIRATNADKVAAWFLDSDYDGATFCVTQAFFPDSTAWEKLARALKTVVDLERFAAFSGTTSLPFTSGPHRRAAVKVIDPRGNEVMTVLNLDAQP